MKKNNYNNLEQDIYSFTLKNGLEVYLLPYLDKKNYYAILGTKYGSLDVEFYDKDGNLIKTPYGTAHFLEHKMFEQEDGIDPFKFFSKTGVSCNASTTFSNTRYYIWGVNELEKNLSFLLDFVYSPYFTDSNVSKEKGITFSSPNCSSIFEKSIERLSILAGVPVLKRYISIPKFFRESVK